MSDAMLGKRFYEQRNDVTGPAWHRITDPYDEPRSAKEAWRIVGGEEGIVTTQEKIVVPAFPDLVIPDTVLVRHPTFDDPEPRYFGVVTEEYQQVTMGQIVTLWDEHVALPVETMGIILEGRCAFLTARLPDWDVRGETMQDYIACNAWFDATGANKIIRTQVREVCWNTVQAGERAAVETYRVVHNRYALERMGNWLRHVRESIDAKTEAIRAACDLLAGTLVTQDRGLHVLEAAYPFPSEPRRDAPEDVMAARLERYEAQRQTTTDRRMAVAELFEEGTGTGMRTKAAMGTLWGLVNCVVELEDYRRGGSDQTAAISSFIGSRAETKRRAFDAAIEAAED